MVAIRYSVRSVVSAHRVLYMPIARWRYRRLEDRIVGPETELVIDGFERSGNWFAVAGFLRVQRRPVRLVHHLHAPAPLMAGVRLGIPTLVVVRNPLDAVVSQMIQTQGVRPKQALAAWIRYYKCVLRVRDRVVVAQFERVTRDFGSVIAEVNAEFGTDFELFESTPENVEASFAWIDEINQQRYGTPVETAGARPSPEREELKPNIARRVRRPSLARRREHAMALYEELIADPRDTSAEPLGRWAGREPASWLRRRLHPASPRGLALALTTATAVAVVLASILVDFGRGGTVPSLTPAARASPSLATGSQIPTNPTQLATDLEIVTVRLGHSIETWKADGGTVTWPPPNPLVAQALTQQRIYGALAEDPRLLRQVLRHLPPDLRVEAGANAAAGAALLSLASPSSQATALRTRVPLPADLLLSYYRHAQWRFGVAWQVLAAINFVESRFGRVVSASSAGAQGPMQFIPSTWNAYGLGGNVHDPHDAILGAANYLHASGAPSDYPGALSHYNPSPAYVRAVMLYARQMMRDARNFYAYYNWQVFVLTPRGLKQLTGPGS